MRKLATPTHSILPITHRARAHKTGANVQETWRAFGWTPSRKPHQQGRPS